MKSFIISLILLALLIVLSIMHTNSLDDVTENLLIKNNDIIESVKDDNFDKAIEDVNSMRDYIETKRVILSATLDHTVINNIDQRIASAEGYIYENERSEALSICMELDVYIKNMPKNYKVKIENIL